MADQTVSLKLTADGTGLKAELAQAQSSLEQLGQKAQQAGQQTTAGLNQAEAAARRGAEGFRSAEVAARGTADAFGLTANQARQLAPQLNDLFTQIASGGSPITALIQQAGQITPIFGGMGGAARALGGALLTSQAAMIGTAAALAGLTVGGEAELRAQNRLENQLRATRSDYEALASTVQTTAAAFAQQSNASSSAAQAAAQLAAANRNFSGTAGDLGALLKVANDLSAVTGKDLPAAMQVLTQAMDSPGQVAAQLAASGFRGFTPAIVYQIQLLEESGRKGEAYAETMRIIDANVKGASESTTQLQDAMTRLGNQAQRLWELLKPVATVLAEIAGAALNVAASGVEFIAGTGGGSGAPGSATGASTGSTATADAVGRAIKANPPAVAKQRSAASIEGYRRALADPSTTPEQRQILQSAIDAEAKKGAGGGGGGGRGGGGGGNNAAADFLQNLEDQAALARKGDGASATIFQAQQGFTKAAGGSASQAQLDQVQSLVQKRLTEQAISYTDALQRQAEGKERIADSTAQSTAAGLAEANQVKAEEEARKYATRSASEYDQTVRLLKNSYDGLTAAEQKLRDAQAAGGQDRQLEAILAETAALGKNAEERAKILAQLKERQKIQAEGGDPESAGGQIRIANAGGLAKAGTELDSAKASLDEIANFGTNAMDRVGQALTNAAAAGSAGFKDLKNIGKAVFSELAQEAAKLALVNPIKNAIGGGNAPTFSSIADLLFGKGVKGGTVSSSSSDVAANGGAFTAADPLGFWHGGGVIGTEAPAFSRPVAASMFREAPRYHTGLMPDEFPAILQKGEGVFTPQQMKALAPAGGQGGGYVFSPTVNFQGNAGSEEDRALLLAQMDQLARAHIASAAPQIIGAAKRGLVTDVQRRGFDRVFS